MPKRKDPAADKIESLAEYLRRGWAKRYPVTESDLEKVREAVKVQWEKDQVQKKSEGKHRDKGPDYGY